MTALSDVDVARHAVGIRSASADGLADQHHQSLVGIGGVGPGLAVVQGGGAESGGVPPVGAGLAHAGFEDQQAGVVALGGQV